MKNNRAKSGRKGRIGRPPLHCAYSLTGQDKLLAEHPIIRGYVEDRRVAIVRDVAGSEDALSGQQTVIIDSICSRIKKRLILEVYFEKCGLFDKRKLKMDVLELQPALQFYLSLCAGIDRALIALGLDKKKAEPILTPFEIAAQIDEEKAARAAQRIPEAGEGEIGAPDAKEGHSALDPDDKGEADGQGGAR